MPRRQLCPQCHWLATGHLHCECLLGWQASTMYWGHHEPVPYHTEGDGKVQLHSSLTEVTTVKIGRGGCCQFVAGILPLLSRDTASKDMSSSQNR